jgi:nitrite reductase (NO-forming)
MNETEIHGPRPTRREFIARASVLSLAIPGVGAALTACSAGDEGKPDTTAVPAAPSQTSGGSTPSHNSDSKLDSSLLKGRRHGGTSETGEHGKAATFQRYNPILPPRTEAGLKIHWHAREESVRISDDTVVAAWTFEGSVPGPIVHCSVGDTVEFTLTNEVDVPHSMDFHAAQIDPKVAFRSVAKGQSVTYRFTPKWAGAFMYHCGTAPVLMHIGSGMHGAIIV